MIESLTERLRQKVETQTLENEKIIAAELKKLTNNIRKRLNADLALIQNDITVTSQQMSKDLLTLRRISRYWWMALIVTWLVLGASLIWLWLRPPVNGAMDLSSYQTFTENGRKYLIVPPGSQPVQCMTNGTTVGCVLLPSGE